MRQRRIKNPELGVYEGESDSTKAVGLMVLAFFIMIVAAAVGAIRHFA